MLNQSLGCVTASQENQELRIRLRRLVLQPGLATLQIPIIPTVECRAGQPQLGKRLTR